MITGDHIWPCMKSRNVVWWATRVMYGLGNKPPRKQKPAEINPIFKLNFGRDKFFGCDSFISSPTGHWDMAMARKAWPNALNAQPFNRKVGVYFRGGLFPWGFISATALCIHLTKVTVALLVSADIKELPNRIETMKRQVIDSLKHENDSIKG